MEAAQLAVSCLFSLTSGSSLQCCGSSSLYSDHAHREDFLEHLEQIVKNSTIYNGKQSEYTKAAESMLDLAMAEFSRHEEKLRSLEEKINPAANKSTQVS